MVLIFFFKTTKFFFACYSSLNKHTPWARYVHLCVKYVLLKYLIVWKAKSEILSLMNHIIHFFFKEHSPLLAKFAPLICRTK